MAKAQTAKESVKSESDKTRTRPTRSELKSNIKLLAHQNDILAGAIDTDLPIRELAMKMNDTGGASGSLTLAGNGIQHPGTRLLAAASLSLLELDGTRPPNYRTATLSGRIPGTGERWFIEVASCLSETQTPHALRMKAESERDALAAELAARDAADDRLEAAEGVVEAARMAVFDPMPASLDGGSGQHHMSTEMFEELYRGVGRFEQAVTCDRMFQGERVVDTVREVLAYANLAETGPVPAGQLTISEDAFVALTQEIEVFDGKRARRS